MSSWLTCGKVIPNFTFWHVVQMHILVGANIYFWVVHIERPDTKNRKDCHTYQWNCKYIHDIIHVDKDVSKVNHLEEIYYEYINEINKFECAKNVKLNRQSFDMSQTHLLKRMLIKLWIAFQISLKMPVNRHLA